MAPITKTRSVDPDVARDRAKKAAAARHSLDTYIQSIVNRAPELSAEQRDRLASLLRPTTSGGST